MIDSEVDADTKEESGRSGDHTERNDKPGPLTVVAKRNRVSDQSTILVVVHSTSRWSYKSLIMVCIYTWQIAATKEMFTFKRPHFHRHFLQER